MPEYATPQEILDLVPEDWPYPVSSHAVVRGYHGDRAAIMWWEDTTRALMKVRVEEYVDDKFVGKKVVPYDYAAFDPVTVRSLDASMLDTVMENLWVTTKIKIDDFLEDEANEQIAASGQGVMSVRFNCNGLPDGFGVKLACQSIPEETFEGEMQREIRRLMTARYVGKGLRELSEKMPAMRVTMQKNLSKWAGFLMVNLQDADCLSGGRLVMSCMALWEDGRFSGVWVEKKNVGEFFWLDETLVQIMEREMGQGLML